jgi:membrane-bound lytic murein transglycosylase A
MVAVVAAVLVGSIIAEVTASPLSKQPKPPGKAVKGTSVSYKPVAFAELPGWDEDDHAAALRAFVKSCPRVLAPPKEGGAPPSPGLRGVCEEASRIAAGRITKEAAKAFFETYFVPHAIVHNGPSGLCTGYFEPLLQGSREPQGRFQTPIYKRPPDLVNLVDETQRGAKGSTLTHARRTEKGIEPYATREEIDKGALKGKGLELMYLADAVDVFFLQIQGSGRIKLPDGSTVRVHYDGKNGHPYSSIGRYLIDNGILPADKMTMDELAKWLRADRERGLKVMWQNKSYVFFRELKGTEAREGPLGVLNIPLTAGRSLAVDAGHHALGTPIYVSAPTLTHVPKTRGFRRLMIAQDVGSAIKGPERGDIYFGSGEAAGAIAGKTKHPVKFYALLPRSEPAKAAEASGATSPHKAER